MKLTITSGDGLGDFILRLPWLLAMAKRGWSLQLLVREPTAQLARLAGLKADIVVLKRSPYSAVARRTRDPFASEFNAVADFRPDFVFLGPSQPSFLEEEVVRKLSKFRRGGFRISGDFWPGEGMMDPRELASAYDFCVEISAADDEPRRNMEAARFFLGADTPPAWPPFRFSPDVVSSLRNDGGSDYIVVNAGYRKGDYFQGWGEENWARELKPLADLAPLFFVGDAAEAPSNARIFASFSVGSGHRDATGKIPDLRSLLSILASAKAYVGKDGGVMHLASALGKPVVAVFGGGHWPRFVPVGTKAVVVTARVPCRGCDWRCHLPEPVCVRGLPEGCLLQAWRKLESLETDQTALMELPPSAHGAALLRPACGYPEQKHRERRARLRAERTNALMSPWRRWARRASSVLRG